MPSTSTSRTFGWAAYLGVSWTWCIGMFLPTLLLRDFGWLSFLVFAIPNVLGAAAMGFILTRRGAAWMLTRHRAAVETFSFVTIAFQVYFMGWLAFSSGGWAWFGVVASTALAAMLLTAAAKAGKQRQALAAVIAWLVSIALLVALGVLGGLSLPSGAPTDRTPDLLALAPVCILGFLLCPYLDATFLRAIRHQQDPRATRLSFTIGFGVLFLAMIVATLLYAGMFDSRGLPARIPAATAPAAIVLAAHIGVQLGLTIALHTAALPRTADASPSRAWHKIATRLAVAIGLGMSLLVHHFAGLHTHAGLTIGEIVYRGFMSFYGLVFPAYLWLCAVPMRGTPLLPTRHNLGVAAGAIMVAAPAYWLGFIERETWWLLAGVGVVLIARLFVRPQAA